MVWTAVAVTYRTNYSVGTNCERSMEGRKCNQVWGGVSTNGPTELSV